MKVSARNVFSGKVAAIHAGAINAEVELVTNGGDRIVAVVTQASIKELELVPGKEAFALVKAPWVMLVADGAGVKLSARNRLAGTVTRLAKGAVNSEVVIGLPGGSEVYAIVTNDAVADLGLKEGCPATAVIKASHVVLGVPA